MGHDRFHVILCLRGYNDTVNADFTKKTYLSKKTQMSKMKREGNVLHKAGLRKLFLPQTLVRERLYTKTQYSCSVVKLELNGLMRSSPYYTISSELICGFY